MKTERAGCLSIALALVCWFAPNAWGQTSQDALAERLERLESETESLREEVQVLRSRRDAPVRLPQIAALQPPAAPAPPVPPPPPPPPAAGVPAGEVSLSPDATRAEIKKLMWTKGDFKIIPYGSLWCDMIYQTERTVPGPYTLYVPSREVEGDHAFFVDARRTRLGLDVEGPRIPFFCCAKSSGRVEIDFFGDTVFENKGAVLLRHAYWQVKDDYYAFLVGQTWDVISPLFPGTLNYSVQWDGGNIGYRRAQFRADRYLHVSPELLLTLQGSLNQNAIADFATTAGVDREPSSWPIIEGRVAAKLGPRGEGCLPVDIGVSGHIGETGYDFAALPDPYFLPAIDDARVITWSFNVDLQVPITSRLRFQGEFFTGENLSTFLGGIGQGVSLYTREAIRATGGWIDLRYDWAPRLHSCFGYSLDDPNDNDVVVGRTYNQVVFGNITFDITKKFVTGLEVAYWKTLYGDTREGLIPPNQLGPTEPGESVVTQWMVQYSF